MNGSQTGILAERAATLPADESLLAPDGDVQLSLPQTTMVIVGLSGALWAVLFGAFNMLFG